MIKMNEEEFKKSLNSFLEEKTYIVAFRSNYDSAREFNNELINYIKQLQKQNADLKERYNNMFECHCNRVQVEQLQNNWNELKKYLLEDDWSSVNGEIASKLILKKMQELQGDDKN